MVNNNYMTLAIIGLVALVVVMGFFTFFSKDQLTECAEVSVENTAGLVYGTGVDLRTHTFAGYNMYERVVYFMSWGDNPNNITVGLNEKGIGWLVHKGMPYRVRIMELNNTNPQINIDVTGDKVFDIVRKIGQSFAVLLADTKPLYEYEGYDPADRVITLAELGTNNMKQIGVDDQGYGTLVHKGQSFKVRIPNFAKEDSNLRVDIDGEGSLDISVLVDGTFPLFPETPDNLYTYEDFDADEQTLTFLRSDGTKIETAVLSLEGKSDIVAQGIVYHILVHVDGKSLEMDLDGDGLYDEYIYEGDDFFLE